MCYIAGDECYVPMALSDDCAAVPVKQQSEHFTLAQQQVNPSINTPQHQVHTLIRYTTVQDILSIGTQELD
jgi:hypothetical protein